MKPGYSLDDLQEQLTAEQYAICVRGETEPPGSGEYTDLDAEGTYACVVCHTPLFVSGTKYHSGSGWPSFWQPLSEDALELLQDESHGMVRTEVRCNTCGSHLGHVFDDGPPPSGKRFCINSVALEFTPADKE